MQKTQRHREYLNIGEEVPETFSPAYIKWLILSLFFLFIVTIVFVYLYQNKKGVAHPPVIQKSEMIQKSEPDVMKSTAPTSVSEPVVAQSIITVPAESQSKDANAIPEVQKSAPTIIDLTEQSSVDQTPAKTNETVLQPGPSLTPVPELSQTLTSLSAKTEPNAKPISPTPEISHQLSSEGKPIPSEQTISEGIQNVDNPNIVNNQNKNKLILNGVMISGLEKIALINSQPYHVGDIVLGMKIVAIEFNSVKLQEGNDIFELRVPL